MTDSVIPVWRLKRDVGFWRPIEAIEDAGLDENPRTMPQAGWAPLLTTPPYSDYVSGHASLTGPAAEVIRRTLGERTRSSWSPPTARPLGRIRRSGPSSARRSTQGSGVGSTSVTPWTTATASGTSLLDG